MLLWYIVLCIMTFTLQLCSLFGLILLCLTRENAEGSRFGTPHAPRELVGDLRCIDLLDETQLQIDRFFEHEAFGVGKRLWLEAQKFLWGQA